MNFSVFFYGLTLHVVTTVNSLNKTTILDERLSWHFITSWNWFRPVVSHRMSRLPFKNVRIVNGCRSNNVKVASVQFVAILSVQLHYIRMAVYRLNVRRLNALTFTVCEQNRFTDKQATSGATHFQCLRQAISSTPTSAASLTVHRPAAAQRTLPSLEAGTDLLTAERWTIWLVRTPVSERHLPQNVKVHQAPAATRTRTISRVRRVKRSKNRHFYTLWKHAISLLMKSTCPNFVETRKMNFSSSWTAAPTHSFMWDKMLYSIGVTSLYIQP